MNTIIIEDIEKIPQVLNFPENFIFEKCKLIFEDYKCVIDTKVKSEYIESVDEYCEYLNVTINDLSDTHKIKILVNNGFYCGVELIDTTHPKYEKTLGRCEYPTEMILSICNYIMTTKRDKITKQIISRDKANEKKTNRNDYGNKKVYLLDEIVEYVNDNGLTISSNGTHKINCPCWSVRGHYRHYKSGKVVFVKNYKKGKEREVKEPKGKEYFL